ncbi:ABC transporter ATP-binding protein [bacterium]|nr:ABC transporter ATP-binding protein [candidate division CSSED10-310 bacterium]
MSESVISIRDLGKCYRNRHQTLGDLWALRHVNLEIGQGEIWGIIGRNGAGKSTLLKLLARVTRQSEGNFTIKGRVYSILELGMGFHAELSGLDNLYVAGALQGLTRREIRRLMESIVDFSGLGEAVYQPLRTYSSGMRVRLAFALAAHTSPDILILDEILAVGDEQFQRKCFEVIRAFIERGVTVLFVSHDMKLISLICNHCILLHNGEILDRGDTNTVIESYSQIMGPSISTNKLTLTHAAHYMQLFHGRFRITHRFGLYTSVRANRIWYDPAYILWEDESFQQDRMVLHGHYITLPLSMTWEFTFRNDITLQWDVFLHADTSLHIDRFQVNVMLNTAFNSWGAGGITGKFPERFESAIGEDWSRRWIGSPDSVISAFVDHTRFCGRVDYSTSNTSGVLAVVSSNPEFKAHLLQYLKTWPENEMIKMDDKPIFRSTITLVEMKPEMKTGPHDLHS